MASRRLPKAPPTSPARVAVAAAAHSPNRRWVSASRLSVNEESVTIRNVATVNLTKGLIWSEIRIESSGGSDPLESHGHPAGYSTLLIAIGTITRSVVVVVMVQHVLAFAADSENLDGLHGTCRECTSKAHAVSPSALQRKQAAAERTVRRLQMSIKARSPR